ncbi:MAG: HupE/UreJ family protein [Chthoniobacteraceae bacterium]
MKSLCFCFCFFIFICFAAHAHPVAQGSLDLHLTADAAAATLRISNEQVFVAATLGEGGADAQDFDAMLTAHGAYLLRHFTLLADGTAAPGEVREVRPPVDRSVNGFTTYVLRFPVKSPAQIEVRQDLLTEILFAPGNPWEAPLIARVWHDERPVVEGALLTAKQPLLVPLAQGIAAGFAQPPADHWRLAWDFFRHGIEHITGGWDHALFVAALVLALPGFWRVLALVSVFTFAHTITITLGVLGLVHVRPSVVEPLIAASIVVAAALNLFKPGQPLLTARLGVAFGFGLFHGLGFAGGLSAAMEGFPATTLATAIAGFSVGVEIGHQLVVLPLLGAMALVRHWVPARIPIAVRTGGVAICAAGAWLLAGTLR